MMTIDTLWDLMFFPGVVNATRNITFYTFLEECNSP